jgi:hypothetical protein
VRRIINYIVLLLCFSGTTFSQNDSAAKYDITRTEDDKNIKYDILILRRTIHNSFRIINGHGTPTLNKKELEFCIQHRFGLISSGYEGAWGLDQSNIRIGLDYGLNRNITIGIGRSGLGKTSNGYLKWGIVKPDGTNQYKTAVTWLSDMAYVFEKNTTGLSPYYYTHRINYTHQLLISRNFGLGRHMFMLQLAPTLVHRNLVETMADANDVPLLVGNMRYRISDRIHITGEFVQAFNKRITENNKPAAGVGLEFWTAGHAFQITCSNANALNEFRYMTGDNGSFGKGDIRLGFNIVRRW